MKKSLVLGAALILAAGAASAANTTPATFSGSTALTGLDDMLSLVKVFSEGSFGKILATAMFLVGIGAGILRQSIVAVVAGLGAAASLAFGPQIIEGVFGAVI